MITAPIDLATVRLAKGAHESRTEGVCLLEAAAWIAGEPHSDHPACVCPILAGYGRSLNDALPDDLRQELVPLLPRMIGTACDGHAQRRGLMAADWLVRVYAPTWLHLRPELAEHAQALESLPCIDSWDALVRAQPTLDAERKASAAAGAAAGAAAVDAAWDAAWDAAGAAAWAAAGAAAWDAAGAAAWAAAGAAAGAAARAAAGKALAPTVLTLQRSAIVLLRQMTEVSDA